MVPPEILRLSFPDLGALEREIANNIRYGRVFVGEILDAPLLTEGVLVIVHPVHGRELQLAAQVVMVNYEGPMRGTGIALRNFGPNEVERVQAFAREQGAAAADARPRAMTPEPSPRAMTPEPRPRAMTPEPSPRAMTPEPRPRAMTPEPRPRAMTPHRGQREMPEPGQRRTPVPMPITLMERPRKASPDPRSEAVTLRPSTGPIATGTVPPSAPENDWSDLQSSGLAREAPRSERPAPPAGEPAKRAVPPPSAASDDDWSDFVDPDAQAQAAASGEAASEPESVVEPEPEPEPAQASAPEPLSATTSNDGDEPIDSDADASGQIAAESTAPEAPAEANVNHPVADDDWSDVTAAIAEPNARAAVAARISSTASSKSEAEAAPDAEDDEPCADDGEAAFDDDPSFDPNAPVAPTELQSENRQHRLRALSAVEQLKVARRGELSDRVVVERLYGKQVWEALLQNPRITLPEVARIARKGNVPRPLIESILENGMWIKAPNVRRALLSNPKLTADSVLKLLRMLPKHELKVMEKATAYPMAVRDGARKLLREGGP